MLSQDNSPSFTPRTRSPLKPLLTGFSIVCLAAAGLLATTKEVEWQLPAFDSGISASLNESLPVDRMTTAALSAPGTAGMPDKTTRQTHTTLKAARVKPAEINFKSVELISSSAPAPVISPRRFIKQPGGNIIVSELPYGHKVPVSNGGMPDYYKVVLEPKGKLTEHGLMQRKARPNFGYDQQDIFTGEVPEGAYVLHCQRSDVSPIRPMCWRELQISDDQWVQYRFPREQLKDWWKIEQKVRANIG